MSDKRFIHVLLPYLVEHNAVLNICDTLNVSRIRCFTPVKRPAQTDNWTSKLGDVHISKRFASCLQRRTDSLYTSVPKDSPETTRAVLVPTAGGGEYRIHGPDGVQQTPQARIEFPLSTGSFDVRTEAVY